MNTRQLNRASSVVAVLSAVCVTSVFAADQAEPIFISGVYPHLAVFNSVVQEGRSMYAGGGECGIGAVVPWAGKLWLITYSPHCRSGGSDRLFTIDDIWQFGKPVGRGGPWRQTTVAAAAPSDPYLMTGYDRKSVELSHDAVDTVAFTVEVNFDHRGFRKYQAISVPADKSVVHEFPTGYSAHGVRPRSDTACTATATFV